MQPVDEIGFVTYEFSIVYSVLKLFVLPALFILYFK